MSTEVIILERHEVLWFCKENNENSPENDNNAKNDGEKCDLGGGCGHEVEAGVPDSADEDVITGELLEPGEQDHTNENSNSQKREKARLENRDWEFRIGNWRLI